MCERRELELPASAHDGAAPRSPLSPAPSRRPEFDGIPIIDGPVADGHGHSTGLTIDIDTANNARKAYLIRREFAG